MDYVVGNIAALISGNVTPNRPRVTKRALTPTKHMPSPNVTPKSESVDDRSVFLSPSVQKKKAIVKKSPKRIFQNPDLDVTNENEGSTSLSSPKADKVRKHLKGDLEANVSPKNNSKVANTVQNNDSKSLESLSPKKKNTNDSFNSSAVDYVSSNDLTPKKKKKQRISVAESQTVTETIESTTPNVRTTKKGQKQKKVANTEDVHNNIQVANTNENSGESIKTLKKKKKNRNNSQNEEPEDSDKPVHDVNSEENQTETVSPKKKNKKRKKTIIEKAKKEIEKVERKSTKNKKIKVNPNAVTDKDSDSEHDSDDEIDSETEKTNKEVLENTADAEEQSSDEEEPTPKKKKKVETEETEKVKEVNTEEEIKRTLFVGNVPFSKKCKKEIKKIFSKYGAIESVRIRTVPVKDPRMTPKLAVIKEELHPERTTVNVYVKFAHPQCVDDALAENNTVLNDNHLRVSRSGSTGAEHDPRCSVFVGNVPFGLEDEGLRERFEKCGQIESVRIVRDKKTNAGKGFGYVNFTSRDGVELALALTDEDLTIKNRIMRVKRCTQATQKHAQRGRGSSRGGFQGRSVSQGDRQRNREAGNQFSQRGNFNQGRFQGRGHSQGNRGGRFQGNRGGRFQGNRGGRFQGNRGGRFQGSRGGHNQGSRGDDFQANRGGNFGTQNDGQKQDGAYRRLQNKRKSQEGDDGPPSKTARDGPPREKKERKEFVGMTAEKKKKHKFDKGQKKRKALSEILAS